MCSLTASTRVWRSIYDDGKDFTNCLEESIEFRETRSLYWCGLYYGGKTQTINN